MFSEIIEPIINFLINTIGAWGYVGIFILMAIESSIFPLPSELVLPPAGALIAQGKMSILGVFLASMLGSLVGSLAFYFLAFYLGRKTTDRLIIKYGKVFFIDKEKIEKTEAFFKKYGEITIFIARILPVVRHLISLPAGFAKMNIFKFSVYTALGAGIWAVVLIFVGYFYGENMNLINQSLDLLVWIIIIICIVLTAIYLICKRLKNKKDKFY